MAYRFCLPWLYSILTADFQDRFLALALELSMGKRARVLLSEHLGQDAITKAHGRVTESWQRIGLKQFRKNMGPGNNDFRAARYNPRNTHAFRIVHLRQLFGKPANALS